MTSFHMSGASLRQWKVILRCCVLAMRAFDAVSSILSSDFCLGHVVQPFRMNISKNIYMIQLSISPHTCGCAESMAGRIGHDFKTSSSGGIVDPVAREHLDELELQRAIVTRTSHS